MKLAVNPPTPWPNLQAPASTRKVLCPIGHKRYLLCPIGHNKSPADGRPSWSARWRVGPVEGGNWKRLPNASPPTWGS